MCLPLTPRVSNAILLATCEILTISILLLSVRTLREPNYSWSIRPVALCCSRITRSPGLYCSAIDFAGAWLAPGLLGVRNSDSECLLLGSSSSLRLRFVINTFSSALVYSIRTTACFFSGATSSRICPGSPAWHPYRILTLSPTVKYFSSSLAFTLIFTGTLSNVLIEATCYSLMDSITPVQSWNWPLTTLHLSPTWI